MKNIVLSAVAVFTMSSFAVAGGGIVPIGEPIIEEPIIVENLDAGFYLGLGYGSLKGEQTYTDGNWKVEFNSRDFDQLLLQAGYKFNAYVAVEGRYWFGMNDLTGDYGIYNGVLYNTEENLDAFGIYVKPMYPVTDAFDIYALLGYASTTLNQNFKAGNVVISNSTDLDLDLDGLSWGLGAAYTFNENISIFADYVVLYDDTYDKYDFDASSEFEINIVNVGVSYKF